MKDASPYKQIIYNEGDDKTNAQLVNSYRFRSASPYKYKKWSPDISREEHNRKKREREDEYVKTLESKEKPILLIKKKNLYKDVKSPNLVENRAAQDEYYKVSKNTEVIEDIGEQIQIHEDLIHKKTVVYTPKNDIEGPATLKNIYKIEGLEFLPEGFLELEPILLKDEYEFDSKLHENLFKEEQMKAKVQRRKQYMEKDQQKRREVTIFVVDQYKDKFIEYLDEWYASNKRKMTPDEIEYIAKVLKTDANSLAKLQDLYLHRKKIMNSKKLHGHLYPEGKIRDERFEQLPDNLKKLFVTRPTDIYNDVEPRVYKVNEPYDPKYLKNHKLKRRVNKSQKPISNRAYKSPHSTQNLKGKDQEFLKFTDNFETILNGGTHNPYTNTKSDDGKMFNTTGRIKKDIQYDNDLKSYFDTEINSILDRIKGFSSKPKVHAEPTSNEDNNKFVEQYKEKLGDIRPQSSSEIIRMESQLKKYNRSPMDYKPYAQTDFMNNPEDYSLNPKKSSIISNKAKVSMTADRKSEASPIKESVLIKSQELEKRNYTINKSNVSMDPKELEDNVRVSDIIEPRRVTIVSRNDRGASSVSQKIRPSLVANEYYFQVIDDIIDTNGNRRATILTRNAKGEIIAEQTLDIADIGNFYHNYVVRDRKTGRFSILVRNEKGDSISVTPIRVSSANNEEISTVLQRNGTRRSTIFTKQTDGEVRRSHKIRPTLIGSEYYNQMVDEVIEGNSKKRLTITTTNENGDVVSVSRANPNLMAENYYTELISDLVDENGQRKIVMATKNNRGESVIQQTFTTSLAGILAEQYYTEMLEEIEAQDGKRKITIASKNPRGYTEVSQQFRPSVFGEDYYFEIMQDTVDQHGKRKVTLVARDNRGESIVEKIYEPDTSEIIGEKYYNDLTTELEKELQTLNQTRASTQIRPEVEDFDLEIYESIAPDGHSQVVVTARNTNGAVLLEKAYSIDQAAVLGDEHYDAIINDIEDELANRRKTSLVQRNTIRTRGPTRYTSKLLEISEVEEKQSVSHKSQTRPSQTPDKLYENIVDSAINEHERQLFNKNSVGVAVPRVTRVRDSYYRDLLNDLGFNKKNYGKPRLTQQHSPSRASDDRNKSYTINPSYFEIQRTSSPHRSPATVLDEIRSKGSTLDMSKQKLTEVDNRPKNMTTKAPQQSTVTSKADDRNKAISDASGMKKKSTGSKKDLASKNSILSNNTDPRASVVNGPQSQKNSINSVLLSNLNKKSLADKLIQEERPSVSNLRHTYEENVNNTSLYHTPKQSIAQTNRETVFYDPEHRESIDHNQPSRKVTQKSETMFHDPEEPVTVKPSIIGRPTEFFEPEHHDSTLQEIEPEVNRSSVKQDLVSRDSIKRDSVKRDSVSRDSVKRDSVKRDSVSRDSAKRDSVKRDSVKRDSVSRNSVKRDSVSRDSVNRETETLLIKEELANIKDRGSIYENRDANLGMRDSISSLKPKESVKKNSVISNREPSLQERKTTQIAEDKLREEIEKVMDNFKSDLNDKVVDKIEEELKKENKNQLLDEFYAFCQNELPHDAKFKESMMMVSLFYYFMEKRKLNNQQ